MATRNGSRTAPLVLQGSQTGLTVISPGTPLTRLNYFDGKFLRASDLEAEQRYLRNLVALSNRANGFGVVHGFELQLTGGDSLRILAGLAIDPQGRVLMLPGESTLGVTELIEKSRAALAQQAAVPSGSAEFGDCVVKAEEPVTASGASPEWFLITIAPAEALCGEEDVYGKLCEQSCVTTTDRPWRIEGIVVRALPLPLKVALATSSVVTLGSVHLRSLIASAWFCQEPGLIPSLLSKAGLESDVWCRGAAAPLGSEIPLGVLVRSGGTNQFLDLWTVRRELMETPARRYWQWRMAQRPWDVFLAQVLQFQCQLSDAFRVDPTSDVRDNPCRDAQLLLGEAADHIAELQNIYEYGRDRLTRATRAVRNRLTEEMPFLARDNRSLESFSKRLSAAAQGFSTSAPDRWLIRSGFTELPSAGYLPVIADPGLSVNRQVRRLMGEGVDLRFCVVRPDFVGHAFEEAQHLERISLLDGLEDAARKPQVDILVPDGRIAPDRVEEGTFFDMRLNLGALLPALLLVSAQENRRIGAASTPEPSTLEFSGAARIDAPASGLQSFYYAASTRPFSIRPIKQASLNSKSAPRSPFTRLSALMAGEFIAGDVGTGAGTTTAKTEAALWLSFQAERNLGTLTTGESVSLRGDATFAISVPARSKPLIKPAAAEGEGETVSSQVVLLRVALTGELLVEGLESRTGPLTVRQITGLLTGSLMVTATVAGTPESRSFDLEEALSLVFTSGAQGTSSRIEWSRPTLLSGAILKMAFEREWKTPLQAETLGLVSLPRPTDDDVKDPAPAARASRRQLFHAWQTIDATVRDPNHAAHEAALRGLRNLARALGSSRFADVSAARLFPVSRLASEELTLQATRDWVLFHRRRDKLCRADCPPVMLETRRYALYHFSLTPRIGLAATLFRDASKLEADFVELIEFAPGIQAVVTPHALVQAGWVQDVGSAGPIVEGIIASRGAAAAEGTPLAEARLDSLVEVVRAGYPVADTFAGAVLARIPPSLDMPQVDGVVVLATRQVAVATNCLTVYAVESEAVLNRMAAIIESGEVPNGLKMIEAAFFTGLVPDAVSLQKVQAGWTAANLGALAAGLVVTPPEDTRAADYVAQARALWTALGGSGELATLSGSGVQGQCSAAVIVAGTPAPEISGRKALVIHEFRILTNNSRSLDKPVISGTLNFLNDEPDAADWEGVISTLKTNQIKVNSIKLAVVTGEADDSARVRLRSVLEALNGAGVMESAPTTNLAKLTAEDRKLLQTGHIEAGDFDDIFFVERKQVG